MNDRNMPMDRQKNEKQWKHKKTQDAPYSPEQISDEAALIIFGVWMALFLSLLSCGIAQIYFCVKKRNERYKIKRRMQELQSMFAQSNNMNVFQMNAQPNFPRTLHI